MLHSYHPRSFSLEHEKEKMKEVPKIAFSKIHQKIPTWADFFGTVRSKKVIVGNCLYVKPVWKAKLADKKVKTESFSVFFRLSFFAKVIASEAFQARNSCQTSLPAFKHNEWDETSFCCRLIAKEKPKNNKLNKKIGTNVKMFWCLLGGGWQFSLKVCSCCKLSSWRGTASALETGKFSPVSSLDRF